jgi:hypothetical protein
MILNVRKALLIFCLGFPIGSHAATAGLGSWFKKRIADPITDASDVVYRKASNGVENVVDAASGVATYIYEKTSSGVETVTRKVSEIDADVWMPLVPGGELLYAGRKTLIAGEWVYNKAIAISKWAEAEFKGNTEGTMTFTVPIALSKNGSDYFATQIFGLGDFNSAKAKFTTFDFSQAYLDFPSSMASGRVTWWIDCYDAADCSRFTIIDDYAFTPGSRVSTSSAEWKTKVVSMLNLKGQDGKTKIQEAVMGFEITGYGANPDYMEIKYGFEAGMKGVK